MESRGIGRLKEKPDSAIVLGLTLVCAITRFLTIPASLWEWDDVLFARSLHGFDVALHQPQPPGFPLFVFVARLLRAIAPTDRLALGITSALFASILGAVLYWIYRQIFRDRAAAAAGAWLTIFAPAVLLYSGWPRSDISGLAAGLLGLALALRGRESKGALIAAGAVLGLGMGIRVSVGAAVGPVLAVGMLIWLKRGRWKTVLAAGFAAAAGLVICYFPAMWITGINRYLFALKQHAHYIAVTDTIFVQSSGPQIRERLGRFFVDVWGSGTIAVAVYILAAAGVLCLAAGRKWKALGWLALSFLPCLIFAVCYNTPLAGPLYALPFLPLFTGLAGYALIVGPRLLFRAARRSWPRLTGWPLAAVAGAAMAVWIFPSIELRRKETSPPMQAVNDVMKNQDPKTDTILFEGLFLPYMRYAVENFRVIILSGCLTSGLNMVLPEDAAKREIALTTGPLLNTAGRMFQWTPGPGVERMRRLSLGRYFKAFVTDLKSQRYVTWQNGWYGEENDGRQAWRWMGKRGEVALFVPADAMTLHFRADFVRQAGAGIGATVVFRIDGNEIDRFKTSEENIDRNVAVDTKTLSHRCLLTIETDRAINPKRAGFNEDTRELGLQCFSLEWLPAPGAALKRSVQDQFIGSGWYPAEESERWMTGEATVFLPMMQGEAQLDLAYRLPKFNDGKNSLVTIQLNGQEVDSFFPAAITGTGSYRIPVSVHGEKPAVLTLKTSRTLKGNEGPLGLCVSFLGWRPVPR